MLMWDDIDDMSELTGWDGVIEPSDINDRELERRLLTAQFKAAQRFGHTHDQTKTVSGPEKIIEIDGQLVRLAAYSFEDVDCELCRIENQLNRLDELEGHDWRERVEKANTPEEPKERKAGGAVY